ncbi:hypothetical protein [Streptomyces jumonjinensis]|uniref:hypothetical protein n=1 Tax=Streptomyces jumonjinensis TaxID=1945 RepID=UPI0037AB699A
MTAPENGVPAAADDPWASSYSSPTTPRETYERELDAAGYGEGQRARYIAQSGHDAEYAACQWDEMVVPSAQAAGIIPEPPIDTDDEETAR